MARPLCYERVFSSRADGKSWQVFCHQLIRHPGATLTIVKTKQGAVFGGYADIPWQLDTDWYGTQANFLFKLAGGAADAAQNDHFGSWLATSINDHYQYLCSGKKSLPNGFGMGGQFDYAGLWINDDFAHGHSRGGPLCSTYQSPRLCQEDPFDIDEVEVWLVCPAVQDEEGMEPGSSVLDRAEDMEFLEMSGKKLYSKDLGKPKTEEEDESEHGR
ncbi:TLD-domain-containing protein [Gongronella butleri]|nr:TLD-domain-containing protein [Gongronella butleri]